MGRCGGLALLRHVCKQQLSGKLIWKLNFSNKNDDNNNNMIELAELNQLIFLFENIYSVKIQQ